MKKISFLMVTISILLLSIPAALCSTVYVDTDGSGNYNCDGIDDQIQINQALASGHDIIYLRGPNTYMIDGPCTIYSDTTLTGDSTACIKLVDNAGWGKDIALIQQTSRPTNITIHGFEMDGNHVNQGVGMGYNYYDLIKFTNAYDIDIHNMYLHDNSNDAIFISSSYNDIASNIYDNEIIRSGHEGVYFENTKGGSIFNNTFGVRCNDAIRTYNSDGFSFHDNYIYREAGGFAGFQIQKYGNAVLTGGEIYNNVIDGTAAPGIVLLGEGTYNSKTASGIHIHHNEIYETGERSSHINGGIQIHGWTDVLVENNVIDSCYGDGIVLDDALGLNPSITGTCYITLRNNIVSNTKYYSSTKGNGISDTASGHEFILENNNVWNSAGDNYHGVSAGGNNIQVDPLFADQSNHDYHLKSTSGRWFDNGWVFDTVASPLIDAGNSMSDYSNEPSPNGNRVNIGRYGNTAEASKSVSDQPTSASGIRPNCHRRRRR